MDQLEDSLKTEGVRPHFSLKTWLLPQDATHWGVAVHGESGHAHLPPFFARS